MALPELLGGLSHELAQPLNAISLACEVLYLKLNRLTLDQSDSIFFENKLAGIKGQVARAVGTLNGLRRYIRSPGNVSTGEIETSLSRVYNFFQQQFVARGIEFNIDVRDREVTTIKFDPVLLDLILAQCMAFARENVDLLESLHKEKGSSYDKRIRAFLDLSSEMNSLLISWEPGVLKIEDNGQSVPLRVRIGLMAAKRLLASLGGEIKIGNEYIGLDFKRKI